MKKVCGVAAGLVLFVAVTVFALAQGQQGMMEGAKTKAGMMEGKMEEGKSEMKGMGSKDMDMKAEMMKAGKSEMEGMAEKKGQMMEGEMKKATGMMQ